MPPPYNACLGLPMHKTDGVSRPLSFRWFYVVIRRNLSPGGSADLLAVTWFLHFIKRMNDAPDGGEDNG